MRRIVLFVVIPLLLALVGIPFYLYVRGTSSAQIAVQRGVPSHVPDSVAARARTVPVPTIPPLSLARIFSEHLLPTVLSNAIKIIATGDVIPGRLSDAKMRVKGVNYPFEETKELLLSGDMTISNLEAPLLGNCLVHTEGMSFCGIQKFAQAMKDNGITVATLENNHIRNHGLSGVAETKTYLSEAGVDYATLEEPFYTTIKGIRFGVIAVNGVGPRFNKDALRTLIHEVKDNSDVVIVSVHWGREYTHVPDSAPGIAWDDPRDIGHFFIDAGVDLVIGNHPHWVQSVELYNNGYIAYGHGNFIFDQNWSQETMEGVVGAYLFDGARLVDVTYTPIVIRDNTQPTIASGERKEKIIQDMRAASEAIQGK
jgi:poly-gamma-glutamate synthesis protein (capsule biosynthesis protein)